jgi:uncharacterized protein (TIGR02147 family)
LSDVPVFQYSKIEDFLQYQLRRELVSSSEGRRKTSLQRLAKSLGYRTPSILSMVARGDRLPSKKMIENLATRWKLAEKEKEYLTLLVKLQKSVRRGQDAIAIRERISQLAGHHRPNQISLQQFSAIRDWYHLPIQTLIASGDFKEDPQWISKRLRRKVTPGQVKKAIQNLLDLGIVVREAETGHLRASLEHVEGPNGVPSEAIREHHKGMIQRALESVEEQDVESRYLNALTFAIDPKDLPEAREKILEFFKEFKERFDKTSSPRIYQLNVQLFEHTRIPKSKEDRDENA